MSTKHVPKMVAIKQACAPRRIGVVMKAVGLSIDVAGLQLAIGDMVQIGDAGGTSTPAEVVAVHGNRSVCMPLATPKDIRVGMPVTAVPDGLTVPVGPGLLGRVIDGLGNPMDGLGPIDADTRVDFDNQAPNPLTRRRVDTPLSLGVRALDTLVPAGEGQRFGIFAGSGVGKSSLLSMITRGTDADIVVLCLVGERGREVREFLEDDLGAEGRKRAVVVIATSDQPAVVRMRSAGLATRAAEYYRDQGLNVVLMMDSLTRFAMASREIGLATGEPPATKGYPPSTFSHLARLLERAGPGERGTITGIYTVLVDGDDHDEPIADAARSILDGHVVLTRKLATKGHFPSIDVLESVSRVTNAVTTPEQRQVSTALRQILAAKRDMQDLIDVGAYAAGSNQLVDAGIACEAEIDAFLRQDTHDIQTRDGAWIALEGLMAQILQAIAPTEQGT